MDELMERYEKLHQAIRRVSKNRGEYAGGGGCALNPDISEKGNNPQLAEDIARLFYFDE